MAAPRRLSLVALALLTACSGAASSDLFDPTSDPAATDPSVVDDGDPAPPTDDQGSTSSSTSSSSSSSGATSSSGTSGTADAGDPPPPPDPPDPPACAAETEPNDGFAAADPFDGCVTGAIKPREIDYFTTTAPNAATSIAIKHAETGGKVAYRVFVDGDPYPAFTDEPLTPIPAKPNATYVFQLQPAGLSTKQRVYKLEVSFQ